MKHFILITLAFLSQATFANGDSTMTFLLLGQSNMAGKGNVSELDAKMKTLPKNVTFFLHGSASEISRQPRFGPEVSFAKQLAKAHPHKKINLVKFAPGGSMMKDWLKGRQHYRTMTTQLNRVQKNHKLNVSGVLWMHGERDTRSISNANNYKRNLKMFISTIRQDLKKAHLPIVIAQISVPEAFSPAAIKQIKRAQQETARDLHSVKVFSTEQLSKRPDKVHYDSSGQIELGRLFARHF